MPRLNGEQLAEELRELYEQVPATCCASSGECCFLTEKEMEEGYATMFPLYRAEYLNIVRWVGEKFPGEKREELLAVTEERPRRCPFLAGDNRCTIYPVRPLICRTYGVMTPSAIAEAVERHEGEVPEGWLRGFAIREGGMVCPRVMVTQPEKLARHAFNLITSAYERALVRLGGRVELVEGEERQKLIRRLIGRRLPERWTWGGFNALRFAPLEWIRTNLGKYWNRAEFRGP